MELNDLSGSKIGKWNVGESRRVYTEKTSRKVYVCVCDCGVESFVSHNHLVDGKSTQCKSCLGKEKRGINSPHWTGFEEISGNFFNKYKIGANKRGLEFEIDIEYIWNLFLEQEKKCSITGLVIDMKSRNYEDKTGCGIHHQGDASLDRINPKLGYIKGNVQWVHKMVNKMKWDISREDFINFCKATHFYKEKKLVCWLIQLTM